MRSPHINKLGVKNQRRKICQAIQVQRGVGTSLYGSGALGGLINIITKDSPTEGSLTANLMVGQYGLKRLGIDYHSGIIGERLAITSNIHFVRGGSQGNRIGKSGRSC